MLKAKRSPIKRETGLPLYEQLCDRLADQIRDGTFRVGDRLPSVRRLSRQMRISITTVLGSYQRLEAQGLIAARAQSGFYVLPRARPEGGRLPRHAEPAPRPMPVDLGGHIIQKMDEAADPSLIQLGEAIPNPEHLPTARLLRLIATEGRRLGARMNAYTVASGLPALRVQIARRLADAGCLVSPDEIIVTMGCTEAYALALRAICKPGDAVAVEGPTFFGFLHALEMQGLRALAIPGDAETGMDLDKLSRAIEKFPVRACLVNPSFNNPIGSLMPPDRKRRLAEMLTERGIPLIEDDLYGELAFDGRRPPLARGLARGADTLVCSSFSKTIAPGLRVGWIVPGAHYDRILKLKIALNLCAPALTQVALARFLEQENYDLHLRRIRRIYQECTEAMRRAVLEYFPEGTCVSHPAGGFVLWIEMPQSVDADELSRQARNLGMTIAPGTLFSPANRYPNFIRLNCAYWSERTDQALQALGRLAARMAK